MERHLWTRWCAARCAFAWAHDSDLQLASRRQFCCDSACFARALTRGAAACEFDAQNSTGYDLHKFAQTTLGSGDMRQAVALPSDTDLNEWLAVNSESPRVDAPPAYALCACHR